MPRLRQIIPRCAMMLCTLLVLAVGPARSSSEDAWQEFRSTVETECRALAQTLDTWVTDISVNPFGSESYGAALVGIGHDDGNVDRVICIYDKQSKTAELTAPFPPDP